MNRREFEFISYRELSDVKLFFVDIAFRGMHLHKEFELFRVFSGEVDVNCQSVSYHLKEGDFALLNPRRPHEMHARSDTPVRIMPMQVSPSFWARFYPQISNVEFDAVRIDEYLGSRRESLTRHYIRAARAYMEKEPYYELRCAAHINAVMEILLSRVPWHYLTDQQKETKRGEALRLGRIINYIEEHCTEKLLLRDLCELEGLSLHHLSRYLSAQLGMSFQEYLAMLRCRRARLLLERTDMKPGDIAGSSGFSDMRYLNRVFLKEYRCSPAEYRRRFQAGEISPSSEAEGSVQSFPGEEESLAYLKDWMAAQGLGPIEAGV